MRGEISPNGLLIDLLNKAILLVVHLIVGLLAGVMKLSIINEQLPREEDL